jgi:uncharacterized membrane protein YphA (DoxX/SURF4 family)
MDSQEIAIVLRLVLGITLTLGGITKIKYLSVFVQGVLQYRVLPVSLARWYGRLLPFVEVGTGAFLILGLGTQIVAVVSALIFASFAIAVGVNLTRKREMPCYCFGADTSDKMGWHTLLRIMLLFGMAVGLTVSPSSTSWWWALISGSVRVDVPSLVPLLALAAFGLLALSFVEISPWIIRAWRAPALRPDHREDASMWVREPESTT